MVWNSRTNVPKLLPCVPFLLFYCTLPICFHKSTPHLFRPTSIFITIQPWAFYMVRPYSLVGVSTLRTKGKWEPMGCWKLRVKFHPFTLSVFVSNILLELSTKTLTWILYRIFGLMYEKKSDLSEWKWEAFGEKMQSDFGSSETLT